jgi:hypothetical protein
MGAIIEDWPDGTFEVEVSNPETGETIAMFVARPDGAELAEP